MGHALLSPSGASRWLACTPSARFEEQFPSRSGSAADEGTLAHALCELYLKNHLKIISAVAYKSELKKIKNNSFYNKEMDDHCFGYVNFILDKLEQLKDPGIFIEEKIDLSAYVPEGFGTSDFIAVSDYILEMVDFKYGKGVKVDAFENKQLMLYALGALVKFILLYDIKLVRMTIYQPRLDNYPSFEISAQELLAWGKNHVKEKAQLAFKGLGQYSPGEHCRFCKAKVHCRAIADQNMALAKEAFDDPNKLNDEEIAGILEKADNIKTWLNAVQDFALTESVNNNKTWPGFKLVAGRSVRRLVNQDSIFEALKKAKVNKNLYLSEPTLLGIGALEKNLGKDKVESLLGSFIIKPAGAPTLVPEWDKRPALNSNEAAASAFEGVDPNC